MCIQTTLQRPDKQQRRLQKSNDVSASLIVCKVVCVLEGGVCMECASVFERGGSVDGVCWSVCERGGMCVSVCEGKLWMDVHG